MSDDQLYQPLNRDDEPQKPSVEAWFRQGRLCEMLTFFVVSARSVVTFSVAYPMWVQCSYGIIMTSMIACYYNCDVISSETYLSALQRPFVHKASMTKQETLYLFAICILSHTPAAYTTWTSDYNGPGGYALFILDIALINLLDFFSHQASFFKKAVQHHVLYTHANHLSYTPDFFDEALIVGFEECDSSLNGLSASFKRAIDVKHQITITALQKRQVVAMTIAGMFIFLSDILNIMSITAQWMRIICCIFVAMTAVASLACARHSNKVESVRPSYLFLLKENDASDALTNSWTCKHIADFVSIKTVMTSLLIFSALHGSKNNSNHFMYLLNGMKLDVSLETSKLIIHLYSILVPILFGLIINGQESYLEKATIIAALNAQANSNERHDPHATPTSSNADNNASDPLVPHSNDATQGSVLDDRGSVSIHHSISSADSTTNNEDLAGNQHSILSP